MPAYNEEECIAATLDEIRCNILDVVESSCLLVVNDGSRDGTGPALDALAEQDQRIQVYHKKNGGHGSAVLAGLDRVNSDYVFLIDSDRQIPLTDFLDFWKEITTGKDAVFGVRRQRHDPQIRIWLTAFIRMLMPLMFGVKLFDANVPFKLISRSVWNEARTVIPDDTLTPSLFLAIYVKLKGFKVVEIPVTHRERATGTVSIKRWKLLSFCFRAFLQTLAFRRRIRT